MSALADWLIENMTIQSKGVVTYQEISILLDEISLHLENWFYFP